MAADLLRPVHDATRGKDGFVCLEVSPDLAHDAPGTIAEAHRLWARTARSNVMIKVPATREGLLAIEALTAEGINVNVTLLFGLPRYAEVADAYLSGLEARAAKGADLRSISSVASFFLSRVDVLMHPRLEALGGHDERAKLLAGEIAVASAKVAYRMFRELFGGERFARLAARGARAQRLLWASTGTKNPAYSDVKYVDALIGPDTVSTVPPETLEAYRRHGDPAPRLEQDVDAAAEALATLGKLGIDLGEACQRLEEEGLRKFREPWDRLRAAIEARRAACLSELGGSGGGETRTLAQRLAAVASRARFEDLSSDARAALCLHVLDALGCAIGALDAEPVAAVRAVVEELGGRPRCTLLGAGRSAPDRAALLQRRARPLPRFQRLLPGEERDLPPERRPRGSARRRRVRRRERPRVSRPRSPSATRSSAASPTSRRSAIAGSTTRRRERMRSPRALSRALGLDAERTAHAIAIAGASLNALRVTRTGELSQLEGARIPQHGLVRDPRRVSRAGRHHRPARRLRGREGLHGGHRRAVPDRLGVGGARARAPHNYQALRRRDPRAIGDRGRPRAARSRRLRRRPRSSASRSRSSTSPTGSSAAAKRATRRRWQRGSRPTTRCLTWLPWPCSTASCYPEQYAPERIARADVQEPAPPRRRAARGGPLAPLPGRARVPSAALAARRRGSVRRKARLRRVLHTTCVVGRGPCEIRPAGRRRSRSRRHATRLPEAVRRLPELDAAALCALLARVRGAREEGSARAA